MQRIIPNYNILNKLYESTNSIVYRGYRTRDNLPVILKLLNKEYPKPIELSRFNREYEITSNMNLDGVIRCYSLEPCENSLIMVIEDFGGESINKLFLNSKMDVLQFLPIAIVIVDILAKIHQKHIIHKDINPANIVFNPKTGKLKIIDFGISTELSKENPELINPNVIEGTLSYISPEQTGRINRPIDYRTDFYSLGVMFYELLTGETPFKTDDKMEMIHCHIAKIPILPQILNPNIPSMIAMIVMKLLVKDAEDRYKSAYGIAEDLRICLNQLKKHGRIEQFQIGQKEIPSSLNISQKIYGRDEEIKQILESFNQVKSGMKKLLLVGGYSGIGKSSVVNEIHKSITDSRVFFISGKYDQFKRNIPYIAIIQAFKELIKYILAESKDVTLNFKKKLLNAFGSSGQVIIDVIPELELIIEKQPTVDQLDPEQSRNRFNMLFQNFLQVFASKEHPLIIFLDDLQWVDLPSLKLIELFMTDIENSYLLIIGAYRDNEVNDYHPLMITIDDLKKKQVDIQLLNLKPLTIELSNMLISGTFSKRAEDCLPLSKICVEKTLGNPFFINQLLLFLYEDKKIYFDIIKNDWCFDLNEINASNISDNVVDLMVQKILKLPENTQKLIQLASCIGNKFDLDMLSIVYEESKIKTVEVLFEALKENLILPIDNSYKFISIFNVHLNIPYRFSHDRIQQAAYSMIEESDKKKLHFKIGRLLLNNLNEEAQEEKLFDIVNHLNFGIDLIYEQNEKDKIIELNLKAGKKAKNSAAYSNAYEYLLKGLDIIGDDGWEKNYRLTLFFHEEAAGAAYLNTDYDKTEYHFNIIDKKVTNILDKVAFYEIKILVLIGQGKYKEALNVGLQILRLLGVKYPKNPNIIYVLFAILKLKMVFIGKTDEVILGISDLKDPFALVKIRIMQKIGSAAFLSKPELFILLMTDAIKITMKYGFDQLSSTGYFIPLGLVYCDMGDIDNGYRFAKIALRMLEDKSSIKTETTRIYMLMHSFIQHWKNHLKESFQPLLFSYQSRIQTGDIESACYALMFYNYKVFFSGKNLKEIEIEQLKYIKATKNLKQKMPLDSLNILYQMILNLTSPYEISTHFTGVFFDEDKMLEKLKKEENFFSTSIFCILKLMLNYLSWQYKDGHSFSIETGKYSKTVLGTIFIPIFNFYDSLNILALSESVQAKERKRLLKKIAENQKKMKLWAHHAPMNFLNKWYLVEAEKARILKQDIKAIEYYDKAINLSKENEYIQEEALANELASKFFIAKGNNDIASVYLNKAIYKYELWGASAKVKHLKDHFPLLIFKSNRFSLSEDDKKKTQLSSSSSEDALELDHITIIKSSQAISQETVLEQLIKTLMKLSIENAGAQNGFLILENKGQLCIEAEINLNEEARTLKEPIPIESDLLEEVFSIPVSIINYAVKTHECVIINNAMQNKQFISDKYIIKNKPKSVLCMPILHHAKLLGILYMENNLTTDAFTKDRLEVLKILTSQAAISIENARLYTNLEEKINERTEQLAESNKKLSQAIIQVESTSQAKSEFLAKMSHEIRTPLNAIMGMTQILLEDDLALKQKDRINTIKSSSEHLLNIINDILDFSKIESGKLTLEQIPFDLLDCVKQVEEMIAIKFKQSGLIFSSAIEKSIHSHRIGDTVRIKQILLNLLSNAIKFTHQGDIILEIKNFDQIYQPEMLLFSVQDTGIGISKEQQKIIFEEFSQADSSTTRKYGGTGLGLSISKKLIEKMGGTIWIESELNKGTKFLFTLFLPKSEPLEETAEPEISTPLLHNIPKFSRSLKVLYAEDNEKNIEVLRAFLEHLPVDLDIVNDGQSAIDTFTSSNYDLVFMDIEMPVMDGCTATEHIRIYEKEKKLKETPIIALTASAFDDTKKRCYESGCTDFISKPFKKTEIVNSLYKYANNNNLKENLSILYAEDNENNRKVLCFYLEQLPIKVDIAENGEEAFKKFITNKYDLVLMDMEMPVMDGNEASQSIRRYEEEKRLSPIPIIALTANRFEDIQDRYDMKNYSAFLSKPFAKKDLLDLISKIIK
ncbi:MAG: response regulator [Desulfobacterales bacterium]|nr:response regulator [Desulfobacterales bacterium]